VTSQPRITHTVQVSAYIRPLDLRDSNGVSVICGALLHNDYLGASDLYTESTLVDAPVLAVTFDWMAI
jgi:hypothetical protein